MSPAQPTTHASNDAQTWSMFLVLAAIWGSSFLFIKIGLDEGIHPMTLVSLRTAFASAMLGAVLLARGGRLPLRWDIWKRMAFLGTTNIVVPFVLIAWGQQYIPSGMTSILNSTVPLFTIVLAAIALTDEHITVARLAGLGIGMGGVVLLALPSLDAAQTDDDALRAVVGMLAVVLAAIFYAVAAVYTRRRLTGHAIIERADGSFRAPSPGEISFGSAFAAFIIITVLAVLFERPGGVLYALPASGLGWLAMIWLGALGTGVAYLLFFRLIERWGATRTTLVTYVIPVVAITLGFVFLGERLLPLEIAGAALIIAGVVLVNAGVGQRPLFQRPTVEAPVE